MVNNRDSNGGSPPARPSSSRAASHRSAASQSSEHYSLSDNPVADGFRPNTDNTPNVDTGSSENVIRTPETNDTGSRDAEPGSNPQSALRNRPSSVAKPHRPHESLTLRHERGNASPSQPSFPRISNASTEMPAFRPDSPYRGPTGPSHPYQMYPQRTLSNATSTQAAPALEPGSSSEGQQVPTHPYTLYTQSTSGLDESPSASIPVGFNNVQDNYRRQIGPEGEDAGAMIGPMGHTEELPPYTRYPEVAYVRKPGDSSVESETPSTSSASPPVIPPVASGAGGLGMATRDPEFSSTEEDLPMTRPRPSVRSQNSQSSRLNITAAASTLTEKSRHSKWQKRAKKKLWGIIPYWAICLVVVGMVLMGIIMGAVIGTLLSEDEGDEDGGPWKDSDGDNENKAPLNNGPSNYTTVPAGLQPITTGTFGLPPLDINAQPKGCFNDTTEAQAWSCNIPYRFYSIDITKIKNASSVANYDLQLIAFNQSDAQFIWGTQPPSVPKPLVLQLVNDTFDEGRGPAWWLKIEYNKTVIVREEGFNPSKRKLKRTWDPNDHSMADFDPTRLRKSSKGAVEGDKPWICTWPNTRLEIFIYPNATSSLQSPTSAAADGAYAQPTPIYDGDNGYADAEGDPMKAYPRVVKFLERRSGNSNAKATCRQVEILAGGYDTRDCLDDDGKPIKVEIDEKTIEQDDLEVDNAKREVRREWFSNTGLWRREAQELTPCSCYWLST